MLLNFCGNVSSHSGTTASYGEKRKDDIDYDRIARSCEGFTGSDIFELCKQASYFPVRDLLEDEKNGKTAHMPIALKQSNLEKALGKFKKVKGGSSEYRVALRKNSEPDEGANVQNAILKISEIMSNIVANQSDQSEYEAQDP